MARKHAETYPPGHTLTTAELRDLTARETAEETFRGQLRKHAASVGYRCYHTYISKGSDPGFPDEIFLREFPTPQMIVVECKRVGKYPTPVQCEWIDLFRAVAGVAHGSVAVYVWTPADWDEIYNILR